jgi:hypothetical protein
MFLIIVIQAFQMSKFSNIPIHTTQVQKKFEMNIR